MMPRRLNDVELHALAVTYCTHDFVDAYADLIDPEVTFARGGDEINIAEIPYHMKVTLPMSAASYSPFPH